MAPRAYAARLHRLVVALAAALVFGCGADDGPDAEAVVKEWGEAVNARDWQRACELSTQSPKDCEDGLRSDFAGARLEFDGPATNGGEMQPGERYFAFGGNLGTVFVTAVPENDGFRVRVEAMVVR